MMTSNNNRAFEVMLTLFKDETKTFGRNSILRRDILDVPAPPAIRCRMPRGRGRCRGTISELSLTQMCAYHQARQTGDVNLDNVRRLSTASPGLYTLVFGRRRFLPANY